MLPVELFFSIFMNVVIYNKGDKALALWKQNVQSQRYYTSFYSKERLSEAMFLQETCIQGMTHTFHEKFERQKHFPKPHFLLIFISSCILCWSQILSVRFPAQFPTFSISIHEPAFKFMQRRPVKEFGLSNSKSVNQILYPSNQLFICVIHT